MVEAFENRPAISSDSGESPLQTEASMLLASNPIEPNGGRDRSGNNVVPDITIDNQVELNNRIKTDSSSRSRSDATGIGFGGEGGDGGDGGNSRSTSISGAEGGNVGDVSSTSEGSSASVETNHEGDLFIYNDTPDLPDLPGGSSGVHSRTEIEGIGSHETTVWEAKEGDATTLGFSVGVPGSVGVGFGFGTSSTYTSDDGVQRLEEAATTQDAGTSMFWGQVLQRDADPNNDAISRHLTLEGARLLNRQVQSSMEEE